MKKYLSKKRVFALFISISMLISAIVLIPIPIEYVSADDLYSAEEASQYTEPIILPIVDNYDDYEESVFIDTTDDDITDVDTSDIDAADVDTMDDNTMYIDTDYKDDIGDGIESDIGEGIESDIESNIEKSNKSNVIDGTYSGLCGEDTCHCNTGQNTEHSDVCNKCNEVCGDVCCETCDETRCVTCDEECICGICEDCDKECICGICEDCEEECICDICEYCEGECTCGVVDFSMLRSDFLVARNVNSYDLLNRIIIANILTGQAANFVGDANNATINAAISRGDPVIIQISSSFNIDTVITVPRRHNIIIISQENVQNTTYTLTMTSNNRHFAVSEDATLTLQSVILRGTQNPTPETTHSNTRGGIDVNGGILTMEAGAQIINSCVGRTNGTGGGGVAVLGGGRFIMNKDSRIAGNWMNPSTGGGFRGGGGVYVGERGTFIMNGGFIENNEMTMKTSSDFRHVGGGGVYVANRGTFELNDGTIKGNKATPPNAYQNGGGGVFVAAEGKMKMNDGLITKNRVDIANMIWVGGGGIFTAGNVTMHNGKIHENISEENGGGVFVGQGGYFLMYEGEITKNEALTNTKSLHSGGGVIITGGIFETDNPEGRIAEKIISGNYGAVNGGGFIVRAKHLNDYSGRGELTIVDGTIITGNIADPKAATSQERSVGGAVMLSGEGILNLYGGEIYDNTAGNSKGITWINGTINLKGNPRVSGTDYVHRDIVNTNYNYVMNILAPLGDKTHINLRENTTDRGRPENQGSETVIAKISPDIENQAEEYAGYFNYMGSGTPRGAWSVIPRDPEKSRDLILGKAPPPTKFALLRVPDTIHFGERPLLTTKLVGPYGDAPNASSVQADYNKGMENWSFGFEITNTRHDNWTLTLQAVPFTNDDGIIGANPIAVSKDANNPTTEDLISAPLRVITRKNEKGESIKFHWTQLDYKIEAQTALNTVIVDDFQSIFTWTLLKAPT